MRHGGPDSAPEGRSKKDQADDLSSRAAVGLRHGSGSMRFLHTADWQLGKPFAGVEDPAKQALLRQERLACLARVGEVAHEHGAEFIVVSGDLFDSPHATKATVAAACAAIGALKLPVYAIPGNHDHGGPGGLWEQPFFQREAQQLAPNLQVLLRAEPVRLEGAVLLPCPLLRRHEPEDTTLWLRDPVLVASLDDRPRIVLAHGSVQGFGSSESHGADDGAVVGTNYIDLARLPEGAYDYVALGDWHGTKQVGTHAWYSGTPELDRFPKGGDHDPGQVLLVTVHRGAAPEVKPIRTARLAWHGLSFHCADDAGVAQLHAELAALIAQRVDQDLLQLELTGTLSLSATTQLEQSLESLQARLLRLKLNNRVVLAPSPAEIDALTTRSGDPLIARVATRLAQAKEGAGEEAELARLALRLLHSTCVAAEA